MQGLVGEEPSVECARVGGNVERRPICSAFVEVPVQIGQGAEDGVEIVGGKIVEVDPKLGLSLTAESTRSLHHIHDLFDVGESIGPRGAP